MKVNIAFFRTDTPNPALLVWCDSPDRHRSFVYSNLTSPEEARALNEGDPHYLQFLVGFPNDGELIMDENPETAEGDTDGIYVYFETKNGMLDANTVKVFSEEAEPMATAHHQLRWKTLKMSALRDNIADFLGCDITDVPVEMMKRATNASEFAAKNNISSDPQVMAGFLFHVSFSED